MTVALLSSETNRLCDSHTVDQSHSRPSRPRTIYVYQLCNAAVLTYYCYQVTHNHLGDSTRPWSKQSTHISPVQVSAVLTPHHQPSQLTPHSFIAGLFIFIIFHQRSPWNGLDLFI